MDIENINGQHVTLTAMRGDVLDIYKMIDLAANVDPSILGVEEQHRFSLLQQFMILLSDAKDPLTFGFTLGNLRDLSQILEGVNVVDRDDFFGKDSCDFPGDDRMQALTENVTDLYERTWSNNPPH